jgi:hypothetical protein
MHQHRMELDPPGSSKPALPQPASMQPMAMPLPPGIPFASLSGRSHHAHCMERLSRVMSSSCQTCAFCWMLSAMSTVH